MKTLDTTQFASSTATTSRTGVTSVIERSIINSRSTLATGKQGAFAIGSSSTISNCTMTNKSSKSAAFQAESVAQETMGLSTSRSINRGEVFAVSQNDVQMENCFFITARSGGFAINALNIRGIADQARQSETGNWKISNFQSGNQSQRIKQAA